MEKSEVQRKVQLATSEEVFRKTGRIFVPVASSARHVHLCHADVERLFGPGHQLTVFRMLSQPGQYACTEQVTIVGPKGQLAKVRVLGPERSATQVDLRLLFLRCLLWLLPWAAALAYWVWSTSWKVTGPTTLLPKARVSSSLWRAAALCFSV